MKREGDYIKHPPPTLYNVESFSFVNIHFYLRILYVYTPCVSTLSLSHTRTLFLLLYTKSLHNSLQLFIDDFVVLSISRARSSLKLCWSICPVDIFFCPDVNIYNRHTYLIWYYPIMNINLRYNGDIFFFSMRKIFRYY